jgi:hypothetical protein
MTTDQRELVDSIPFDTLQMAVANGPVQRVKRTTARNGHSMASFESL